MRYKYLLLLFIQLFICSKGGFSQSHDSIPAVVLSEQRLIELQDKEPYKTYVEVEDNSFSLSTLKRWIKWFFSKLSQNKASFRFSQALPYIIAIVMLVLIVLKVAGLSFTSIIKPKNRKVSNNSFYSDDDPIHEVAFDKLIKDSLNSSNYRLAIRYSYMQLLQVLDNKSLIIWEKQKSNYDYLFALKQTSFYQLFVDVTRIYEDAWYGEMPWTAEMYKEKYDNFVSESLQIHNQINP